MNRVFVAGALLLLGSAPCLAQSSQPTQTPAAAPALAWAKAIAEARKQGVLERLAGKRFYRPQKAGGRIKVVVTEIIDHGQELEFTYFVLRPDLRARIERYRLDAKGCLATFELLMGNEKGVERGIRGKATEKGLDLEVFGPGGQNRVLRACAPGTLPLIVAEHLLPALGKFLPAKVDLKVLLGTQTHPGATAFLRLPEADSDRPGGAGEDTSWLLTVEGAEGAPHLHATIWASQAGEISGIRMGRYLRSITPEEGRKLLGLPEPEAKPKKPEPEAEATPAPEGSKTGE